MEQKDKWSKNVWIVTVLVAITLAAILIITRNTTWQFNIVVGVTASIIISMWA